MPSLPRPVAKSLYKVAVRAVGEGRLFRHLEELRRLEWSEPATLREFQCHYLQRVLENARKRSPYYTKRIPEFDYLGEPNRVLKRIPLLSKQDLQTHWAQLQQENFSGRTSRKTTGGSTGEPVTVVKSRDATARERAAMWLAYGWFGVEVGDRAARFWGTPYTWKRRLTSSVGDFFMNRIRFSAFEFGEEELGSYWQRLHEYQPDYVHGYVSMLEEMARFALATGRERSLPGLKSVIATSEVLTEPQRAVIQEAFQAPVQVEYGCGEVGPIAHECPEGNLHLFTPNVWVECLSEEGSAVASGESGELVITDLHNLTMPLIRYRIGDFGIMSDEPCSCGRSFPVLKKVWGRAYDVIEDQNGRMYHGEFFMYIFEDLRSNGLSFRQFQVVQDSSSRITILVTSDSVVSKRELETVVEMVSRRLQGVETTVRQVSEIPREASGKMRVIKRTSELSE